MGCFYRLNDFGFKFASGAHILPRVASDALEEANKLIAAAKANAEDIIGTAESFREEEKKRGYAEGRELAFAEAVRLMFEESKILVSAIANVEKDLTTLVVSCVRKIIENADCVTQADAAIRYALDKMRREKRVEFRAAPAVYPALRDKIEQIKSEFPEIELIDVMEDCSFDGSRVVVSSSLGAIDCDTVSSLDVLEKIIRSAVARSSNARESDDILGSIDESATNAD